MAYKRTKSNGVTTTYNERKQKTTHSTHYGDSSNGGLRSFSQTSTSKQYTTETYKTSQGFIERKRISQPKPTKLPRTTKHYKPPSTNIRNIKQSVVKQVRSPKQYRSKSKGDFDAVIVVSVIVGILLLLNLFM